MEIIKGNMENEYCAKYTVNVIKKDMEVDLHKRVIYKNDRYTSKITNSAWILLINIMKGKKQKQKR